MTRRVAGMKALRFLAPVLWLAAATSVPAAVTAAPGWAVRAIPTPATVQGGVVRRGGAILVGQGAFGAGLQHIVRLEGASITVIATGFNSLGGFALDGSGTLYAVDNGGALPGAVTGDTVFAIPNALTRTTPLPAAGAEVLPPGSLPFAQDIAIDGGALLVSTADGPGAGRVVRISGTTVTDLVTGLDYTAGLTVEGGQVVVGNVDATFSGSLLRFTSAGVFVDTLVAGLSGTYAHDRDNAGNLLVTGGFTGDFSSGTLIAVAPGGGISERARGFVFSTELFHDRLRDETLVLDAGASAIAAICRDRDGDGGCDADDPCTGGAVVTRPKLQLKKLDTPPGDDKLVFTGQITIPSVPVLDPAAGGARLAIAGASGVLADVTIPPGVVDPVTKAGWKLNGQRTTWTYKNRAGVAGITRVVVKTTPKVAGLVRFAVSAKWGSFPATRTSLPLTAVFSLNSAAGQCGTADFGGPVAACLFNAKGNTVSCK